MSGLARLDRLARFPEVTGAVIPRVRLNFEAVV